ncbi:MAG: glycosyltransferase [Nitrososphaerales archaeon]
MTAVEVDTSETRPTVYQPLLSVIVPVFNGGEKIGETLKELQVKIGEIESVMWKVEYQRSTKEASILRAPELVAGGGITKVADQEEIMVYASGTPVETPGTPNEIIDHQSEYDSGNRESIQRSFSTLPMWYEIIVVNDGSQDNTRELVEKLSTNDERIKLISYSVNMGKGYAIKQGVLHSSGKYILIMDGDGNINADVLAKYLKRMNNVDIVIGSKYHPRSIVHAPASRKILSKCFQLFAKAMLGLAVRDSQVGLKAGRGDVFRKIFEKVIVRRYAFDVEMLAIANLMELKVLELPVKIDQDKSFKKKEMVKMALDVLGIAFRLRVIKWYQKNLEKQRPHYSLPIFF